jgi:hypothetical protein
MKKLLAILVLIAGVAHADYWTYPTKDNGEIVLTTEMFASDHVIKNCRNWFAGYVIDKFNRVIYGCWNVMNDKIHMYFTDGDFRVYTKDNWVYHKDEK